jgi:hypothetical protein
MKKTVFITLFLISCLLAEAQLRTPDASPAGSVSTVVGLTDIKINYARPSIKGRTIFGNDANALVPYGKIWRTGANSGTVISFSDDVTVEGKSVPKGEYLLLTWPGESEWTVALHKNVRLGGNTAGYVESEDAAKFTVKSKKLADKVETFFVGVSDIAADNKSAKIQIAWENTEIKFTVGVDYDKQVMKAIETYTKIEPYTYFRAASYYYENGKDLNQALTWVTLAAEGMGSPFWVLYQKALIQKALGDKKGAIATANDSLEKAKKEGNRDYQKMNEALIKSIK